VDELEEHFGKMCPRVRAAVAKIKTQSAMADAGPPSRSPTGRGIASPSWECGAPHASVHRARRLSGVRRRRMFRDNLKKYGGDAARAFLAYQAPRIERTARVQGMARLFGEIKHVHGVSIQMRNALLAKRTADDSKIFLNGHGSSCEACMTPSLDVPNRADVRRPRSSLVSDDAIRAIFEIVGGRLASSALRI